METSQKRNVFIDSLPKSFISPTGVEPVVCSIFRVSLRQKQGQNPTFTDPMIKIRRSTVAVTWRRCAGGCPGNGHVTGHGAAAFDLQFAKANRADDPAC